MSDRPFQRLLRNASTLLGGNVAGAGLAFLSMLIAARALGPEGLGRIVLVQTVVLGVDRLVNFQCWRAVIKYGSDALAAEDRHDLARVIKFGLMLDAISAVAGMLIAGAASFAAARWFDWDTATLRMSLAYSAVLCLHLTGAATAVLRLFDYFRAFALQRLAAGATKLALIVLMVALDAPAWAYLAAWIAADAVAFVSLAVMGAWVYRRQELPSLWSVPVRGTRERNPGILRFAFITNLSTALRTVVRDADNFLIGVLLGEAAVGLYQVARQFAGIMAQAYDPLHQALYPQLARDASEKKPDAFDRNILFGAAIAGGIAAASVVGVVLLGEWAIRIATGPEFVSAYPVMVAYMIGVAVNLGTFFVGPATLSLGRPTAALRAVAVSTVVYLAALVLLVQQFGLVGAGWAHVVFCFTLASWMVGELLSARRAWRASLESST